MAEFTSERQKINFLSIYRAPDSNIIPDVRTITSKKEGEII